MRKTFAKISYSRRSLLRAKGQINVFNFIWFTEFEFEFSSQTLLSLPEYTHVHRAQACNQAMLSVKNDMQTNAYIHAQSNNMVQLLSEWVSESKSVSEWDSLQIQMLQTFNCFARTSRNGDNTKHSVNVHMYSIIHTAI